MSATRLFLFWLVVLAMFVAVATMTGCETLYQSTSDETAWITPDEYETLPAAEQAGYVAKKVVNYETATTIDSGVATAEKVVTVVQPLAELVPYGGAVMAFLGGLITMWRKLKPEITAGRQVMQGLNDVKESDGEAWGKVAPALSTATTAESRAVIRAVKNKLGLAKAG